MKTIYLIGGIMGVGKTMVCQEDLGIDAIRAQPEQR